MTIKSGKLIDGYVLAAWNKDVSFGTIILPGKEGWKAETDIAIFGNARARTLITLQADAEPALRKPDGCCSGGREG
jgi:hypothetical protein